MMESDGKSSAGENVWRSSEGSFKVESHRQTNRQLESINTPVVMLKSHSVTSAVLICGLFRSPRYPVSAERHQPFQRQC